MKPVVLVGPLEGNFLASFALGWSVTIFSGVCAYLFDTLRRRMMLASGQPSEYKNTIHASKHIISTEGLPPTCFLGSREQELSLGMISFMVLVLRPS